MSTQILKNNKKKFSIANNLRNLRKYKEITLEQLAKNININFDTARNYELDDNIPHMETIIKMSNHFQVSIDFLFDNNTNYARNIKLLSLSKQIDKMDQVNRFQIENTANSLLKSKDNKSNTNIKTDIININLTNSIHENIKDIRENKSMPQKYIAEYLQVTQGLIAHYESKSVPNIDKLIKLSKLFNISIHALATGSLLNFEFQNKNLGDTMLLADQLLTLEEHKILIYLMETIINND